MNDKEKKEYLKQLDDEVDKRESYGWYVIYFFLLVLISYLCGNLIVENL